MKFSLLFLLLLTGQLYAQPANPSHHIPPRPVDKQTPVFRINSTEICNNNIDDDNNGLRDQDDFACYFPGASAAACNPTAIIWTCNWIGDIYWANLATGAEHYVGRTGSSFTDLTWASNGKLYGLGGFPAGIHEIDPNTAAVTPAFVFPLGQLGSNSMTADFNGNLYFTASYSPRDFSIMRMNMATGETCVVADLLTPGFSSAGDLTFLNGYLYLSGGQNKIIKIDVQTGKTQGITVINSTTAGYYGLVSIGDGYLYAADNGKIYRIDAGTMTVEKAPVFSFNTTNMFIYGLASYSELCQAPKCPYQTTITSTFKGPFCEGSDVKLWSSDAICSRSSVTFTWTLPNGNTVVTDTLLATDPGKYYANYQMTGGVCTKIDSFEVVRVPRPLVSLGNDTSLCTGEPIDIALTNATGFTSFRWKNGATTPGITITQPGWYWIDVGTSCGIIRDSIYVQHIPPVCPKKVTISAATPPPYCQGIGLELQAGASCNAGTGSYTWITPSGNELAADRLAAIQPGKYYLTFRAGQTVCTAIDSFLLEYFPLPHLNLGKDTGICSGKPITLLPLNTTGFTVFKWQNGTTTPALNISSAGWYWLDAGTICEWTRDSIFVRQKTDWECETSVIIPTAFTPNNDGRNDLFKPVVRNALSQYELKIYNRWGQQVFSTNDAYKGWNGTINGNPQSTGLYIWTCRYLDNNDQVHAQRGTITLTR